MPDSTIDRLFLMLEAQAKLASKERKELVEAFERQISGLRLEVRGIAPAGVSSTSRTVTP